MSTDKLAKRSPLKFFLLTFALATPFWLIGSMVKRGLPVPMNLPVSALSFVSPLIAALILTYRKSKLFGIEQLFKRIFDYKKIKPKLGMTLLDFLQFVAAAPLVQRIFAQCLQHAVAVFVALPFNNHQ